MVVSNKKNRKDAVIEMIRDYNEGLADGDDVGYLLEEILDIVLTSVFSDRDLWDIHGVFSGKSS